mmetsp:Transcript_42047/g.70016  ORF Transcript_42047/g.70016 Transcript_42047/m.70016 type:complete len:1016 (-) Transcript_42047:245-3292(-)
MYWRIGFGNASPIDGILDRKEFTLQNLLDEDELIQEVKSMNKKLVAYLSQPDILKDLLVLLTTEPETSASVERRFKYPFLACEIVCCETGPILDAMFSRDDLMGQLFSFMDGPPPLNPLLAGYFCRVVTSLLNRKTLETYLFMQKTEDLIARLVNHIGTYSIMTLLLKVINPDDVNMVILTSAQKDSVMEWLAQSGLSQQLVNKLEASFDSEIHTNAAEALIGIIAKQLGPGATSAILVQQLQSADTLHQLFVHVLSGSASALVNGLGIICELVDRTKDNTFPISPSSTTAGSPQQENSVKEDQLPPLIVSIIEHIDDFCSLLREYPPTGSMQTTFGPLSPPLGSSRLKVIEFFVQLFSTKFPQVYLHLLKSDALNACLDLFFQYKWNNFLHSSVEKMVSVILESGDEALRNKLIQGSRLVDRILEAVEENKVACSQPKGSRLGYMGFVTRMSNALLKVVTNDASARALLEGNANWQAYADGILAATNTAETRGFGPMPASVSHEENEEDELFGRAELDMEVLSNITDFKPNGGDQRFERYFFDSNDMNEDLDHLPDENENSEFPFDPDVDSEFDASGAFTADDQHGSSETRAFESQSGSSTAATGASAASEMPVWLEREIVDNSKQSSTKKAPSPQKAAQQQRGSTSPRSPDTRPSRPDPHEAQIVEDDDNDDVVLHNTADEDDREVPEEIEGFRGGSGTATTATASRSSYSASPLRNSSTTPLPTPTTTSSITVASVPNPTPSSDAWSEFTSSSANVIALIPQTPSLAPPALPPSALPLAVSVSSSPPPPLPPATTSWTASFDGVPSFEANFDEAFKSITDAAKAAQSSISGFAPTAVTAMEEKDLFGTTTDIAHASSLFDEFTRSQTSPPLSLPDPSSFSSSSSSSSSIPLPPSTTKIPSQPQPFTTSADWAAEFPSFETDGDSIMRDSTVTPPPQSSDASMNDVHPPPPNIIDSAPQLRSSISLFGTIVNQSETTPSPPTDNTSPSCVVASATAEAQQYWSHINHIEAAKE